MKSNTKSPVAKKRKEAKNLFCYNCNKNNYYTNKCSKSKNLKN